MIVKVTSKRQVTFPARVLDTLGIGPGDRIELVEHEGGYLLRPCRVDRTKLGILAQELTGTAPFDLEVFRNGGYDPTLGD